MVSLVIRESALIPQGEGDIRGQMDWVFLGKKKAGANRLP